MNRAVALERIVFAVVPLLTVWGIWSYGLWDPWELGAPDTLGVGRLPGVVAGWLTCLLAFVLFDRHVGRRAGVIAIAVIASPPLFLLNARLVMGDAILTFVQTWVGLTAIAVVCGPRTARHELASYILLGFGVAFSGHTSGVLLGPLPPVLAVAAVSWLSDDTGQGSRIGRWLLPLTASILVFGVIRAVLLDDPGFNHWLGGGAVGGNPPTFDEAIALVFHGFAPWSAALPVAAIWAPLGRGSRTRGSQDVACGAALWASCGFPCWTGPSSPYGTPP